MTEDPRRRLGLFSQVTPVRAYESVAKQIETAIGRGEIRPGDRLPPERDLVEQFGVSRATIREALRVLENAGLIRSRPGGPIGGAEVLPFSNDRLVRSLSTLVRVEHLSLRELVEFRMLIASTACGMAALFHTDDGLLAIESAHARLADSVGDRQAFADADLEFHQAIADSTGNTLLAACSAVL